MKKIDLLWVITFMALSVAVHAADYNWTTGTGNWTDGWDEGGYPSNSSDKAFVTGGTQNLTPASNPGASLSAIQVKASSDGTTLNISESITTAGHFVMCWNNRGAAYVNHSAGVFRSNDSVWLGGLGGKSISVYNLSGSAQFKVPNTVLVAKGEKSAAILNIRGGTLNAWGSGIYVGNGDGSRGTINLSGGLLKQSGGMVYVGDNGSGTVKQTSGKFWLNNANMVLANAASASGTYTISGGEIDTTLGRWVLVKDGGTFVVDGSGASSIEMSRLDVAIGGVVRINLDVGGSTLVKSSRTDVGQGLRFRDGSILELDTAAGFKGTIGDTYDLFWAQTGNIEIGNMTFSNLSSSTDFSLAVVSKGGGDVLQATVTAFHPAYGAWATTWGVDIGAEMEDYDHDGVPNIYEFGLDGDPTNASIHGTLPVYSIEKMGVSNVVRCIHPQRAGAGSGLEYTLSISTNLLGGVWATNTGYVVEGTNITGTVLDFVTNTINIMADQEYIRLLVDNPPANPRFTLWQIPSWGGTQMMSYVLESSRGSVLVIDGGWEVDGSYLAHFLAERGSHVSAWFITHPHADHIKALTWLLSNPSGITIDNIYASFPPMEWFQEHAPGTAGTLNNFFTALTAAGKSYTDVDPGDVFDFDEIHIEILVTENPEITVSAVNNSSMTMRVSDPSKTVLFLGDLGLEGGNKLLGNVDHAKLKADYVQMAHHGQGAVSEAFYQVVRPDYCLWPTPLWLWNNDNGGGTDSGPWTTLETRQWMEDLNVKRNYVSGISGLIKID